MQINTRFVPLGYQQLASPAAATALTVPTGATVAVFTAEAQNIRWRDDGTNPTASVGMLLVSGTTFEYAGTLSAVRVIQATGGGILNISYYSISG